MFNFLIITSRIKLIIIQYSLFLITAHDHQLLLPIWKEVEREGDPCRRRLLDGFRHARRGTFKLRSPAAKREIADRKTDRQPYSASIPPQSHMWLKRRTTEWLDRMSHRKWRKTKQHPSRAAPSHQISCCLVHFLCDILSDHPVQGGQTAKQIYE